MVTSIQLWNIQYFWFTAANAQDFRLCDSITEIGGDFYILYEWYSGSVHLSHGAEYWQGFKSTEMLQYNLLQGWSLRNKMKSDKALADITLKTSAGEWI